MNVTNGLSGFFDRWGSMVSSRLRSDSRQEMADDAKEIVQAAKGSLDDEAMRTWDKHTDMVEKAQELRQIRDRKDALERQSQERREEETELMAKVAIENANRSSMIQAESLIRQAEELMAVA